MHGAAYGGQETPTTRSIGIRPGWGCQALQGVAWTEAGIFLGGSHLEPASALETLKTMRAMGPVSAWPTSFLFDREEAGARVRPLAVWHSPGRT